MLIFLVGYMGSGKSSFGKKLAAKLHFNFIDLDNHIEKQTQSSISTIFEKYGDDTFRKIEHECLINLLAEKKLVIATGGGTACYYNNMELINKNGISIYLQASIDLLKSRLIKSQKERPLLKGKSEEELKNFIQESLKLREVYYLKANYIVDAKNANVDQLVNILHSS